MIDAIKRIYNSYKNLQLVKNAVIKDWITPEQYKEITGQLYDLA